MRKIAVQSFVAIAGLVLFAAVQCRAQGACSVRYSQPVFSKLDTTRDVPYGRNVAVSGSMDTLKCDIYQPAGDTSRSRPLLVLTHGGSFTTGDKTEPDIVRLCVAFASRGYVTASINYRLGVAGVLPTGSELARANIRAVQDERAAVRYFRSRADSLHIDTTLIFAGGTSAGAFTAIQHAYLDQSEIPAGMDTSGLGGLEGASGTPGYSSRIRGVINLWGAIGDTAWINQGDVPIVSIHGTADNTVPYDAGWVFGISGVYWVYGSASIHRRAIGHGVYSVLRLFSGMGHQFPVTSPQMDTAEGVISDFLGTVINCDSGHVAVIQAYNGSRPAQGSAGAWLCMKQAGVMQLSPDARLDDIRFYDCFGRIVDMHPVHLGCAGSFRITAAAPGVYVAADTKNKNHVAMPLHLF
jgi:poly(3-hydroxybutyrate) depolymerase